MPEPSQSQFTFRLLTEQDVDDILSIQKVVADALTDQTILETLSRDEYLYMLEGNGAMFGVFAGDEFVGFRAVLEPPIDEEHLGHDINLAEDELKHVLYQEISMVLPSYRGHGLQQQLATEIMEHVTQSDKTYTYICSTVAPVNIPSLKDKFNQGMYTVTLKQTYGEKWRYTFVKPLESTWEFDETETKVVELDQFNEHIRLLQAGWYGVALDGESDAFTITYKRRVKRNG